MAGEIAPLGYQGNLGFWGLDSHGQPKNTWWNTDMSDAGQVLYADPTTAVSAAAMPKELVQQADQAKGDARKARGGFMASLSGLLGKADAALSNIPGFGMAKEAVKTAWWPVDKLASGAYWLYSNTVSQPLSTLIIQAAKAEMTPQGAGVLMSGDEWAQAYGKAEHVSPGQALVNAYDTSQASGQTWAGPIFNPVTEAFTSPLTLISQGTGPDLDPQKQAAVRRNTERFLYDSDFWRAKQGWKYTVGTGALDFAVNMAADPASIGLKGVSAVVKGTRSIKIAEEGAQAAKGTERVQKLLTSTPEQASRSDSINKFFDWAHGKTAAEIAQHPIWGTGRRVNPARDQLSQVFAQADREEMPLVMRFAAGDNVAAAELVNRNEDLMTQIAKMEDNRVLVDSAKFDNELFQSMSSGLPETRFPMLTDIPPKPVDGTPAQIAGWEKTYGALAERQRGLEEPALAVRETEQLGLRGLGPAANTSLADIMMAQDWRAAKLQEIDTHLNALYAKQNYYRDTLGSLATKVDDFAPGQSNLFGTMKTMYRMGPAALRDTEAAGNRAIRRLGAGKDYGQLSAAKGPVNFATTLLRNGFYSAPIRVVQSFSEQLPEKFIDHNAADAYQRVADMLKQVPGLGADTRLDMIRKYSQAGDKVARSKVLEEIHSSVIDHMAARHNLDYQTARAIDQMHKVGIQKTMMELTGQRAPSQMFSAAPEEAGLPLTSGNRVDMVEDGEGYMVSPLAKSQLQIAEPLLPVRELDRVLSRSAGFLGSLRKAGGAVTDNLTAVSDLMNTTWKAATLLRPGYVLRSQSEEQVASAVKFGIISSILNLGEGGKNWALNRAQHVWAYAKPGGSSYVSSIGGKGVVTLTDEAGVRAAQARGLETRRISVNKAWPIINAKISDERESLAEVEKQIAKLQAKGGEGPTVDNLMSMADDHRRVINEYTDYASAVLQEAEKATGRRLGEGVYEHRGYQIPQAFKGGLGGWEHPIPRDQITSAHADATIFARSEAIDNARLIKTGDWKAITPGGTEAEQRIHMDAWLHGINNQFRQDDLFRIVAEDPSLKKAREWVRSAAGKNHLMQLGPRSRDSEGTIQAIKTTLDHYLPEGTGLQQKLAKGEEIGEQELRAAIAKEDFPQVHGEEFKALTAKFSKETPMHAVDRIIEKGFKLLSTVPNDVMARQPIYLRAQEARMRQLIDQHLRYKRDMGLAEDMGIDDLQKMLEKSDKMARKDISQVVYDPTRTTATEALRFVTPFLSAHIDGLARWGGLVAEKPQFLGTAAKVYNAPVAAGLITDQYGRPVDQTGHVEVEDPDGKKHKEFVTLENRTLTLRSPSGTKNIKGVGRVKAGGVRLGLNSLNTILPGDPWFNPGVGPFAQIPLSVVGKQVPQVGDFAQWAKILPYGPMQGDVKEQVMRGLTPAYIQDAWDAADANWGGTGEAYQGALLAEWQRQSAEHANGGPAPDWKLVQHNAKQFMFLDALTNWLSPARTKETPLSRSPYQFFIDQYKAMQDVDPAGAKDKFFQRYGEHYFAFTASLSKSIGVQATLPAQHTAEKYGDLIANDPDLAGLIVGDVYSEGKFSNSVYRKQMDTLLNGVRERTPLTALEAISQNKKDLGWKKYGRFMDMLDAEMIRSGFHSYNQAGAQPLADVKSQIVQALAQENPTWYEDFGNTDTTRLHTRIEGMKRLVSDEKIQADPIRSMDLAPLAAYLQQRDALQAALRQRGSSQLSFGVDGQPVGQNADIGMQLRTLQLYLVNNSLGFGDIFHRYLENDDLS